MVHTAQRDATKVANQGKGCASDAAATIGYSVAVAGDVDSLLLLSAGSALVARVGGKR